MKKHRKGFDARWFLFFFKRSISQRKGRVVIASASVMLAVGVVTAMFGITFGIKDKLGSELKAYGANIIVSPQSGDFLDYGALEKISRLDHVEDITGQVFGRVLINKQAVEVIGLDVNKVKDRGWRLFGTWPARAGEILAGIKLKEGLKIEAGRTVPVESDAKRTGFVISGIIEKGGTEDSALIMSLPEAWELTGTGGKLSALLVRGRSGELQSVVRNVRNALPSAAVKTFRQVAFAEESLLVKIQLLMALVTVVVMLATGISVASTMGANVLERREEIGLMKAIGATKKDISSFYMAEAVLIGIMGAFTGFLFGYVSAQAVSKGAFNSFVALPFYLPFVSLAIGLVVSLFAGYVPVREAMRYDPAVILRGE